jgi:hypothetical protein
MPDEEVEKSAKPAEAGLEPEATAVPEAPPAASSEPKKKKKKKKKKREVEAEPEMPSGPVLGPEGSERPTFVLDFPKDAELDRVVRAFELGNYVFVREHARKLAESASDQAVRRAAEELLRRIEPDPLVKILLAMSVALFLFMVFYAYSHGH